MGEPSKEAVRAAVDAVVAAMRGAGVWAIERPPDEAFAEMGAFGARTMAFAQWLRWVFVPNVERLIESGGPWPSSSQVAVMATREGDTDPVIASLVPALARFDAVFDDDDDDDDDSGPSDGSAPEPSAAEEAYRQSRALLGAGDRGGARRAVERVLTLAPTFPNAENFAGWILFSAPDRSEADLTRAIEHFRTAVSNEPGVTAPLVNLADALAASGKKDEAVAMMERHATAASGCAGADYWLGWWFSQREHDLQRALPHARRAASLERSWGLARSRLADILERSGQSDEAYEEHAAALACEGTHDRAFSHERRGAYEARRGWWRNALRSLRRARRDDSRCGGARVAQYDEALAWIESQLAARSIAVPADTESESWDRACELEVPPEVALKGQPAEVIGVETLVRAARFDEALAALRALRAAEVWRFVDATGVMERAADRARAAGQKRQAIALLELKEEAHRIDASAAGAAGEAYGRLGEAERTRERIVAWALELGPDD